MENRKKIENPEEKIRLKIRNQTFVKEMDLDPSLKWQAFS
jgi:hypothetical protein